MEMIFYFFFRLIYDDFGFLLHDPKNSKVKFKLINMNILTNQLESFSEDYRFFGVCAIKSFNLDIQRLVCLICF